MQTAIERIESARAEAFEVRAELDRKIEATRNRINELCRRGTVGFDEAFPAWLESFEAYADEGARELEQSLEEFARPNHVNPENGAIRSRGNADAAFKVRRYGSGAFHDTGAVLAHVNRKAIIDQARNWFKQNCAEPNVPPASERQAELERLAGELRGLEEQRDDIQDQLSELFKVDPSERTRQAEREARRDEHIRLLNKAAAEQVGRG